MQKDFESKLFVFDNWGSNQFSNIDEKLTSIFKKKDDSVVQTNL